MTWVIEWTYCGDHPNGFVSYGKTRLNGVTDIGNIQKAAAAIIKDNIRQEVSNTRVLFSVFVGSGSCCAKVTPV